MVYGGFIVMSTLIEFALLSSLRKVLVNPETEETMLPYNRYLIGKWCQGQLANFVTFMHFCFVASALVCLTSEKSETETPKAGSDLIDENTQAILSMISSVLAIIALPILVVSNVRRTIFTCKNIQSQPHIHKLLP